MTINDKNTTKTEKNDKSSGRRLSWILFRYFLKEFSTPFFCCLGGFLTLFVVLDLVNVLSEFLGAKAGFLAMFKYLLLVEPKQILFTVLPMSVLLAASFMVVSMTRHEEVTALRASGISLLACGWPIWILASGISVATLVLNYYPLANRWAAEGRSMLETMGQSASERKNPGRKVAFWSPDGTRQWVVGQYRDYGPKNEVWVWQFSEGKEGGNLKWLLFAAGTEFRGGAAGWDFEDRRVATPAWPACVRADDKARAELFARPVVACLDNEDGGRLLVVAEELRRDPQSGQWVFERGQVETYDAQNRRLSEERFVERPYVWTPPPETAKADFQKPEAANVHFAVRGTAPACAFWSAGVNDINVPEGRLEFRQALQVAYGPGGRPHKLRFSYRQPYVPGIRLVEYRHDLQPGEFQESGDESQHLWASRLAYRRDASGQWSWVYENGFHWGEVLPARIGLLKQGTAPCPASFHGMDETPDNIINAEMKEMLCVQDLRRILRVNARLPEDTRREYLTLVWNRCASSLMPLVAAFIGVAFSLVGQRRNPAVGFAWALGVMVSYYLVDQAMVLAGNSNWLPPMIAGVGATVVFLALSITMMWRRQ